MSSLPPLLSPSIGRGQQFTELRTFANTVFSGQDFIWGKQRMKLEYEWNSSTAILSGNLLFEQSSEGAPGLVHGGAIAAVLDEIVSEAVFKTFDELAYTVSLTVRYKKPARLTELFTFKSWTTARAENKSFVIAQIFDKENALICEAEAIFKFSLKSNL